MDVRLDEAKITLDSGANVLHPLDGTFFMGRDGASSESVAFLVHEPPPGSGYSRLDVLVDHSRLMVICSMFSRLEIHTVSQRQGPSKERSTSFRASIDFWRAAEKSPY